MAVLPVLCKYKSIAGSQSVTIPLWRIPDERGYPIDYRFRRGPYDLDRLLVGVPEKLTVAGLNTADMQTLAQKIFDSLIVPRDNRSTYRTGRTMIRDLWPEYDVSEWMVDAAWRIFWAGIPKGKTRKYQDLFFMGHGDGAELLWEACKQYDRER